VPKAQRCSCSAEEKAQSQGGLFSRIFG
jgi:hypothetical protein